MIELMQICASYFPGSPNVSAQSSPNIYIFTNRAGIFTCFLCNNFFFGFLVFWGFSRNGRLQQAAYNCASDDAKARLTIFLIGWPQPVHGIREYTGWKRSRALATLAAILFTTRPMPSGRCNQLSSHSEIQNILSIQLNACIQCSNMQDKIINYIGLI